MYNTLSWCPLYSIVIHNYSCLNVCVCPSIQKRREREMQQQVECHDEETLELKETYSSLQQEVDIKTKKLKKVDTVVLWTCTSI